MADTTKVVTSPSELASGIILKDGADYEVLVDHPSEPGELEVQVLDELNDPIAGEEYVLLKEGTVLRTGKTTKATPGGKVAAGLIKVASLPIDVYQLVVHGRETDVIPRLPKTSVRQVVHAYRTTKAGTLVPNPIPPRPAQGAL